MENRGKVVDTEIAGEPMGYTGHPGPEHMSNAPNLDDWMEMRGQIAILRQKLLQYGDHAPGCPGRVDSTHICTCGWQRLLVALGK